jgi:putative FmdB family regulatory protein
MPIFEYLCQDCGTNFEKLVRRESDRDELVCPKCGQKHFEQQLSTFAAHSHSASSKQPSAPMCPSGRVCPTPGACGLN